MLSLFWAKSYNELTIKKQNNLKLDSDISFRNIMNDRGWTKQIKKELYILTNPSL